MTTTIPVQLTSSGCGPHYWANYLDPGKCAYQLNHLKQDPIAFDEMIMAFQIGILGHAMLEHWWKTGPYDVFDVAFVSDTEALHPTPNVIAQTLLAVSGFVERTDITSSDVQLVEYSLAKHKIGKALVGGRIDLVIHKSGIWVVDYKFLYPHIPPESRVKLRENYRQSMQLATYVHLLVKDLRRPIAGAKIAVIWKSDNPSGLMLDFKADELIQSEVLIEQYNKAWANKKADRKNFAVCKAFGWNKKSTCPLYKTCVR
jgi:hypothetical protein